MESRVGLRHIVYVLWIVAAIRLITETMTEDLNVVASASVYAAVFVIFLFAAFAGVLDHLAWKRLLLGALLLGVLGWTVPNMVAYSTAQFRGWSFGRYYHDPEFAAIEKPLMEQGMGWWDAQSEAEKQLGRETTSRGPMIADTTAGKLTIAATVGLFTGIAGTLWSLVLGILFVGIPATVRRRRAR